MKKHYIDFKLAIVAICALMIVTCLATNSVGEMRQSPSNLPENDSVVVLSISDNTGRIYHLEPDTPNVILNYEMFDETDLDCREDTITKTIFPEYVTSILWGLIKDVKVVGDFAYCATTTGLAIIEVSDPSDPKLASHFYTAGYANGLDVKSHYAYMACGRDDDCAALMKIDITNPYQPALADTFLSELFGWDVAIGDNIGYILTRGDYELDGVYTFNPDYYSQIYPLGHYFFREPCDIRIRDSLVYITDDTYKSMTILNMSNPADPWRYGSIASQQNALGLAIKDDFVFVGEEVNPFDDEPSKIEVVDVSDPFQPTVVETHTYSPLMFRYPHNMAITDDYLMVTNSNTYVSILDITDPLEISWMRDLSIKGTWGIDIIGNYAYLGGSEGLAIMDISDINNPQFIGGYSQGANGYNSATLNCIAMELVDDYIYLAHDGALSIIDISNPTTPIPMGCDESVVAYNVKVQGNYAYIAQRSKGIRIDDISDPANPVILSNHDTPGYAWDVDVVGDYAYVAADTSGLQIIDITDPFNTRTVGCFNRIYTGGQELYSVNVEGDFAYLGDWSGMVILDVSDPANPKELECKFNAGNMVDRVKIRDSIAYLCTYMTGIQTVNISDPDNPTQIGLYDTYCLVPRDIVLYGDYAFTANELCHTTMHVIDITHPDSMKLEGVFSTPYNNGRAVAVKDSFVYFGDECGLFVLSVDLPGLTGDANGDGGINLLDILYLVDFLYGEPPGHPPEPSHIGDVNSDGDINLIDIISLIDQLYGKALQK